jgi:hypothetical protein
MTAAEAGRGHVRTSHADREQAVEVLKAAFVEGRLTKDEFEARIDRALTSRTYAELAAVTADIPAGLSLAVPSRIPARKRPRVRVNTAVNAGACVVIAAHVGVGAALLSGSVVAVIAMVVFIVIASTAAIGAMLVAR